LIGGTDISFFISGGAFGVVCFCFIIGWIVPKWRYDELKEENKELKQNLAIQTARGDAGVLAAQVTKELVSGLRKELST
jgi:hypothetical protein